MELYNIKKKLITICLIITLLFGSFSMSFALKIEPVSVSQCEGLFSGFNADDNLIASIIGLCLPGVLKNIDRLQQNECEQILCEYEAAQRGLSPILCAKKAAYNTCVITGEGYDVVEGILIGSIRNQIKQVLENPLGLGIDFIKKKLAKRIAACKGVKPCLANEKAANIGLAIIEGAGAIQSLQSLVSQFENIGEEQKSACEQLEDIRPELEKVINDYYSRLGEE